MSAGRLLGIALVIASLLGLGVAVPVMVKRLSGRHVPVVWFNQPIAQESFIFRGEAAEVRTVEATVDAPKTLSITWRGRSLSLPIEEGTRDDPRLPGLLRHDDWLRVLVMAEGARSEEELSAGIDSGAIQARLIVAMRLPAKDFEPGAWGDVPRRREWRYRFVELLPPDPASPSEEPFNVTEGTYAEFDKLADPAYRKANGLEGDIWKYYAMQHVTPPTLYRSKNKPIEDAMQAMGWTWPVAGVAMLVFTVGLVLVFLGGGTGLPARDS